MLEQIARIIELSEDEIRDHPRLLVSVVDSELKVLYINRQCEKYFGFREKQILGKSIVELLPELAKAGKFSFFSRALAGETVYMMNANYERKEGMYDQVTIPLKNTEGTIYAALNIVIDLLRQREEGVQTISLPSTVYLRDQEV